MLGGVMVQTQESGITGHLAIFVQCPSKTGRTTKRAQINQLILREAMLKGNYRKDAQVNDEFSC